MNPWKNNWKKRPTYATKSITEDFPFFIKSQKIKNSGQKQIVSVKNYSVISILKILSCLEKGEKSYTDTYMKSGIRYKRSFNNYMTLCKHFRFISGNPIDFNNIILYSITEKGRIFVDLWKIEEEVLA